MKKLLFLTVILFVIFSCENPILDLEPKSNMEKIAKEWKVVKVEAYENDRTVGSNYLNFTNTGQYTTSFSGSYSSYLGNLGSNVNGTWFFRSNDSEILLNFREYNSNQTRVFKIESLKTTSLILSYDNGNVKISCEPK